MWATGLFVIAGTYDFPLGHNHRSDHGIRACRSPASGRKPEGLLHECDVWIDVTHRRALVFRGRALAFGLDVDVVAATRRAWVLVLAESQGTQGGVRFSVWQQGSNVT